MIPRPVNLRERAGLEGAGATSDSLDEAEEEEEDFEVDAGLLVR